MTEKELKRMSRQELLDELYDYANANTELQLKLEKKEEELRQHFKKFQEDLAAEHQKVLVLKERLRLQELRNKEISGQMNKKNVEMQDAGNIAEATCKMTGIFEEAQKTADLYLKNVREMTERQEKVLMELEEKSRRDIQKMGDEAGRTCIAMKQQAEKECTELRDKTEAECRRMRREAIIDAEEYWDTLSTRLEDFYNAHQGMKELLGDNAYKMIQRKRYI